MTVGQVIKEAREQAQLSQTELARRARVHRTYIWALENDKKSPSIDVFLRISSAVGISPAEMITRITKSD